MNSDLTCFECGEGIYEIFESSYKHKLDNGKTIEVPNFIRYRCPKCGDVVTPDTSLQRLEDKICWRMNYVTEEDKEEMSKLESELARMINFQAWCEAFEKHKGRQEFFITDYEDYLILEDLKVFKKEISSFGYSIDIMDSDKIYGGYCLKVFKKEKKEEIEEVGGEVSKLGFLRRFLKKLMKLTFF